MSRRVSIEELETSLRDAFRHNELEDMIHLSADLLVRQRWQPVYAILENWARGGIAPDGSRTAARIACLFDARTSDRGKKGIPNPLRVYIEALRAWWDQWAMWINARISSQVALVPYSVFFDGVGPQTAKSVHKAIGYRFVVKDELGLRLGCENPMLLVPPECVCYEPTTLLSQHVYTKKSSAYRYDRCPRCKRYWLSSEGIRGTKAELTIIDDPLLRRES